MKKLTFIFLILVAVSPMQLKAQAPKNKKVTLADRSQLIYEVSDNGKTKNGSYTINNKENHGLWVQGFYNEDKPCGTWTFFDAKFQPSLRYNYDQKKIIYINNESFKDVNVNVLSSDTSIIKGASIPIPLCSVDELTSLLSSKLYTMYDNVHDQLQATVTAHINTDGDATYTVSYPSSNGKIQNFKLRVDSDQFKVKWIPSHYNNQPVEADFSLTLTITPNDIERWHRFRWDI